MRPPPLRGEFDEEPTGEENTENADDREPLQQRSPSRRSPKLRSGSGAGEGTKVPSAKRQVSGLRQTEEGKELGEAAVKGLTPGLGELLAQHFEDNDVALDRWARQQQDALQRQKDQFQEMLFEQRRTIEEIVTSRRSFLQSSTEEISEPQSPRDSQIRRPNKRRTTGRNSMVGPEGQMVQPSPTSDQLQKRDMEEVFQELVKDNKILAQPPHRRALSTLGLLPSVDAFVSCTKKLRFVPGPMKRICQRLDGNDWFEMTVLFFIIVNVVFIALGSSDNMRRVVRLYRQTPDNVVPNRTELEPQPAYLIIGDFFFAVLFSVEIIIRFVAEEGHFFVGKNWKWNGLDCAIVASNWMECYLDVIDGESKVEWASWIRVFRLVRVLRTLRLARIMFLFRELRLVLLCLAGSIFPLMWALAVFCAILYVFAVIILQGVSSFLLSSPRDRLVDATGLEYADETNTQYITVMFFSFPRTCLTLLQSVTGGEDWGVVYQQLEKADVYYGISWVLYIMIMIFGVLNVITGIFVESAVSRARNDRENAVADEQAKSKERLRQILALFTDVDQNMDGKITIEEWEKFAQTNGAKTYMGLLGLDVRKTHELFELIDFDGNKEVSLQEFAIGCMQLQGGAKSVDVETLLRNSKKVMKKVTELFETVDEKLEVCMEDQSIVQDRVLELLDKLEYSGHRRNSGMVALPPGGPSLGELIVDSDMITSPCCAGGHAPAQKVHAKAPSSASLVPDRQLSSLSTSAGTHSSNNNSREPKAKRMLSKQKLEKRTMLLLRLGDELVDREVREEFKSALTIVIRDMHSQGSWSNKAFRMVSSELDSLSIRYGLYHHEQKAALAESEEII